MAWLKNWLAQIQGQLSQLNTSQKWLIATLVVIGGACLFVVALYTGQPDMQPLLNGGSLTPAQAASIESYLDSRGVAYSNEGGQLLVPSNERFRVLAALQANEVVTDDSEGFSLLVEKQSLWHSSEQNRQLYTIALQNELAYAVGRMRGVKSAKVIISHPKVTGFDATVRRPSASVNVEMQGEQLDRNTAEAIAALVSGSVAEMEPKHVAVIDAVNGRTFSPRDEHEVVASDYVELVQTQEQIFRDKIASALSYIPQVIVAVNVEVDPARRQTESTKYDSDDSATLPTAERSRIETSTQRRPGGEAAVRANTGVDIAGMQGQTQESSLEENETEFAAHAGMTHERVYQPGGVPTRISATVNVPRSYFVAIYQRGLGGGEGGDDDEKAAPSDAELQAVYDEHLERIRKQVQPLLASKDAGQVVVDVYPDTQPAGPPVEAGAGNGVMQLLDGPVSDYAVPGVLATLAMLTMFIMLRKAGNPTPVPSGEELAGLPPSIEGGMELAGEAGEADAALTGIELDDEQMAQRKMGEQVAELVKANPEEAANLLRQWMRRTE